MRTTKAFGLIPAFLLSLSLLPAVPASAAERFAAIVVDGNTGKTLHARNADARRYPASLTKMMTLYVLFGELEAKRLTLSTRLTVSAKAAAQSPSKLGLRAGRTIKVEDAILALTTKSANDMAVVIAEHVGGSVAGFATRMNRTARALGMMSSTFRNPHGLPDSGQVTTARDMARLGRALQDRFPTYYKYFGVRSFTYAGARHRNHNRLLGSVEGVDGIKTGYTRASGFNLVSNVRRDGRHIIAVVMGGKTAASRDAQVRDLIATYLPKAKRGQRSDPPIIADWKAADETEPVAADVEVADVLAELETRLPRPRPGQTTDSALSYAAPETHHDIVAAAMAEPARAQGSGKLRSAPATAAGPPDSILERIEAATELAELAAAAPGAEDPVERLTEIAQIRSGKREIIAGSAARTIVPVTSEAGWNIQIGAVPTQEGAQALLAKAKLAMGPVLASMQPLTVEIERNGTTLYRARFAGFSGKEEARAACTKLKSKSLACLAVPN